MVILHLICLDELWRSRKERNFIIIADRNIWNYWFSTKHFRVLFLFLFSKNNFTWRRFILVEISVRGQCNSRWFTTKQPFFSLILAVPLLVIENWWILRNTFHHAIIGNFDSIIPGRIFCYKNSKSAKIQQQIIALLALVFIVKYFKFFHNISTKYPFNSD